MVLSFISVITDFLNLYALMNSSVRFDTINLGWFIIYVEGSHVIISKNNVFRSLNVIFV